MRNLSASDWAHGWSDTKKGLGTWQFWLLELVGGSLMFAFGGTVVGVIFVIGMALALWIGATATAPNRQRNELRQMAPKTTQPQLSIEGAISEMDANKTVVFSLKLKNAGTENLQMCKIVCKSIRDDSGAEYSQEVLVFASNPYNEIFNDEYGLFPLLAGEERKIEVARISPPFDRNQFHIRGKGRCTELLALLSEKDYKLEICVLGSAQPVPAVLRLRFDKSLGPRIDLKDEG